MLLVRRQPVLCGQARAQRDATVWLKEDLSKEDFAGGRDGDFMGPVGGMEWAPMLARGEIVL